MRAAPTLILLATALTFPVLSAVAWGEETAAPADAPAAPTHVPRDGDLAPADAELLAAARAADAAWQRRLAALSERVASDQPSVRITAYRELVALQDPEAASILTKVINDGRREPAELAAAVTALGLVGNPAAATQLRKLSSHADATVRLAAYNALGALRNATPIDAQPRANDSDPTHHLAGVTDLGTWKHAEAGPALTTALASDSRAVVRRQAAIGLGRLGDQSHGPALQQALADPDAGVRRYAAEAIATLDYRPAIPHLLFALEANIASADLIRIIHLMTGQDFGFDPGADRFTRQQAVDRGFAWWAAEGAPK